MNLFLFLLTVSVTFLTIQSKSISEKELKPEIHNNVPLFNVEDVRNYLKLKEPKLAQLRYRRSCGGNLRKRHIMRGCPDQQPPGGGGGAGGAPGGDDGLGFDKSSTLSVNSFFMFSVMALTLFR
ncbi:hypothetical protein SNEBB_004555 [Seison nebaliae]|nr:hypothetical protein SNEBB_004555 [Seison nebaliae]